MASLALALTAAGMTTPAQALTLDPVLTGPQNEIHPAASTAYLAWSQNSGSHPNHYDLFARPVGDPMFRVNPPGTGGLTASIDGSTLAYQQVKRKASDIKFFDLLARTSSNPPSGVNTPARESVPSLSGDWLLFRRSRTPYGSLQRILLRNLVTGEQRLLVEGDGLKRWAQPGTVNGNFATYVKCRRLSLCNVFVYDIATDTRTQVPNPMGRALFAASVTAAGTAYFAESTNINCGRGVSIWTYPLGGPKARLATLGRGRDTAVTSPVEDAGVNTTVFFDRYRCRDDAADIYEVVQPA